MKAVVQRVTRSSVTVEGETIAEIGKGLVVLIGIGKNDQSKDAQYLAEKIARLRVFEDEDGKMNSSLSDVNGEILVVSQFTLYGDCRKGRRPSFSESAPPEEANKLYELFVQDLKDCGCSVKTGKFQAYMKVVIENDGPVTLIIESL